MNGPLLITLTPHSVLSSSCLLPLCWWRAARCTLSSWREPSPSSCSRETLHRSACRGLQAVTGRDSWESLNIHWSWSLAYFSSTTISLYCNICNTIPHLNILNQRCLKNGSNDFYFNLETWICKFCMWDWNDGRTGDWELEFSHDS